MRSWSAILGVSLLIVGQAIAAATNETTIIADDFSARKMIDNTLLTLWGTNTSVQTGFRILDKSDLAGKTLRAITVSESAAPYTSYKTNMKTLTAFDYEINKFHRETNTLVVEFDAFWDRMDLTHFPEGEVERITVILLHEYPKGGAKFGDVDRLDKYHPFGRPAYNLRLRNTVKQLGYTMNYGGGKTDVLGALEQYKINDTPICWLPGFVAPQGPGTLGWERSGDYPRSPTKKKHGQVISTNDWMHFTWAIAPERMTLYSRKSRDPETQNQLLGFMEIPKCGDSESDVKTAIDKLNRAHGSSIAELPRLYHWFDRINAIRFYFRGPITYLANIRITAIPNQPVHE
jgi:hypothetical protein